LEDRRSYGRTDGSGRSAGGEDFERVSGRGRFDGPRPFRPSPVQAGEEYEVKIESMSKRGDSGVARVQGLVIFVAGTEVGDTVRIKITKVGRGYATAEVVSKGRSADKVVEIPAATADVESETLLKESEETQS